MRRRGFLAGLMSLAGLALLPAGPPSPIAIEQVELEAGTLGARIADYWERRAIKVLYPSLGFAMNHPEEKR